MIRLADALVRVAAARWPAGERDEVLPEWRAELHALAGERAHGRMLRFALSLAVSRPSAGGGAAAVARDAWRVFRLLVLAPVLSLALVVGGLLAAGLLPAFLPMPSFLDNPTLLWAQGLGTITGAVLAGLIGRRWAFDSPARTVLSAAVSGLAVVLVAYRLVNSPAKFGHHVVPLVVYFAVLAAGLAGIVRLAAGGRRGWALLAGIALILAAGDIQLVVQFAGDPDTRFHLAYAPVWLPSVLFGTSFGLPHPSGEELFTLGDLDDANSNFLLGVAGLAVGAALGSVRRATGRALAVERA